MAETILVIEDERLTRNNLLNFLSSEGFEPLGAENGRTGIELAQTHHPDLIICDIMMPDLDGYDVLTTLQHDPQTAAIPFIFLTVTANELGLQQSLAMGADDYLSKPITSEQLRQAIATQLNKQARKPQLSSLTSATLDSTIPLALDAENLSDLMQVKDTLLDQFCQTMFNRLASLRHAVESLQSMTVEPKYSLLTRNLQAEFTRLLAFTNEVSALQKALTLNNAEALMEQFAQSDEKIRRG